jgi:hypothetical protein
MKRYQIGMSIYILVIFGEGSLCIIHVLSGHFTPFSCPYATEFILIFNDGIVLKILSVEIPLRESK